MIGKIISFFMEKNVQKIVLGAIVVVAGLIMLKKYMDSKKTSNVEIVEEKEVKQPIMQQITQPRAEPVDLPAPTTAEITIEQDPIKDLGQSPMPMPDDSQYSLL